MLSWSCSVYGSVGLQHHVDETESISNNCVAKDGGNVRAEHRPRVTECVEFTAFPAGINGRRKLGQQCGIERASCEPRI
jgi:hypothetical protein